jgi:hypothetical protein
MNPTYPTTPQPTNAPSKSRTGLMKLIFGLSGASENMMQNAVNNTANPVFNLVSHNA